MITGRNHFFILKDKLRNRTFTTQALRHLPLALSSARHRHDNPGLVPQRLIVAHPDTVNVVVVMTA